MTRRGDRRRFAIIGVLAERGRMSSPDLCQTLHLPARTMWFDLSALEADGRIIGEWEEPGPTELFYDPAQAPGLPPPRRRRLYRLTATDERDRRRRLRREVDQEIADRTAAARPPRRRLRLLPGGAA